MLMSSLVKKLRSTGCAPERFRGSRQCLASWNWAPSGVLAGYKRGSPRSLDTPSSSQPPVNLTWDQHQVWVEPCCTWPKTSFLHRVEAYHTPAEGRIQPATSACSCPRCCIKCKSWQPPEGSIINVLTCTADCDVFWPLTVNSPGPVATLGKPSGKCMRRDGNTTSGAAGSHPTRRNVTPEKRNLEMLTTMPNQGVESSWPN